MFRHPKNPFDGWRAIRRLNCVMAVFYDTHAHLDYPDFAPDFDQVVELRGAESGREGRELDAGAKPLEQGARLGGGRVARVVYTEFDDLK